MTTCNVHDYAALAMRFKLFLSTEPRLRALCEGFHQVVPLCSVSSLKWFELEELVCGQRDYDPNVLLDNARYDNLDPNDHRVVYLRQSLKEFTRHQRAMFMRFVSGRERLPPGMRLRIMADTTGGSLSDTPQLQAPADTAPGLAPQPPASGSGAVSSSSFIRQQSTRRANASVGGQGGGPTARTLEVRGGGGEGHGGGGPSSFADSRLPHASTCFYWLFLPNYSSLAVMKERLLFAIEQCIDIDADFRVHDGDTAQQEDEPQLARVNAEEGDDNFESFSHLR